MGKNSEGNPSRNKYGYLKGNGEWQQQTTPTTNSEKRIDTLLRQYAPGIASGANPSPETMQQQEKSHLIVQFKRKRGLL
jgi:hypothetical protein